MPSCNRATLSLTTCCNCCLRRCLCYCMPKFNWRPATAMEAGSGLWRRSRNRGSEGSWQALIMCCYQFSISCKPGRKINLFTSWQLTGGKAANWLERAACSVPFFLLTASRPEPRVHDVAMRKWKSQMKVKVKVGRQQGKLANWFNLCITLR